MKNKFCKLVFFVASFVLLLPALTLGGMVRQDRLENVRAKIFIPEMSSEDKHLLAEQAQLFIRDMYVHRYAKMDYYGNEDPVPAMEEVVANIDNMTTAEMEIALWKIFIVQRDLHLNYFFPSPHKDFTSFLPLTFVRTAGKRNFFQVRIQSINAEKMAQFAPGQRVPVVGDRVLSYNGVPIVEAARDLYSIARGANEYGGFTRAIALMTHITHKRHLVPENNEVTIILRSQDNDDDFSDNDEDGELYSITLPWITEWEDAEPGIRSFDDEQRRFDGKRPNMGVEELQKEFNEFLVRNKLEPLSAYPDNSTQYEEIKWGYIDNRYGHFGYIKLKNFGPLAGIDNTVTEIRRLLLDELVDSDALIFDVRDNPGGYIQLADRLPQLFFPQDAEVIEARLLNTGLNHRIFNESNVGIWEMPEWRQVINDVVGTNRIYTDLAPFTYKWKANEFGQAYYKPVGVLINAKSYSSTDMFTCSMQDNKGAIIYGEDPTTGAGGANVITHEWITRNGTDDFVSLPGDHAMRVSWRQDVRFGDNAGALIEDIGCEADYNVSKTARDVLTGDTRQIRKITRSLSHQFRYYKASVRGEQIPHELSLSIQDLQYGIYVKNTRYVNVLLDGVVIQEVPLFAGKKEKYFEADLTAFLKAGDIAKLRFEGLNSRGELLWHLKRDIVVLGEQVVLDGTELNIDFATVSEIAPLAVVNRNALEDGWNFLPPYLQLGYNPNYADYVDSDAVLYLDMSNVASAQLRSGLEFNTEQGWDFMRIFVTVGQEKTVLYEGSGNQAFQELSFDLSKFAGEAEVVVHFRFSSDSNTNFDGVKLHYISVQ